MPQAFVEMNEARDAMEIYFPYDATAKEKIKEIKGWRFVGRDNNPPNGPHWTVPLNLDAARALREIFGSDLKLGNAVRAWGRDEVQMERNLKSLSIADDAVLVRIPTVAPIIARIIAGDPIPEFKLPKKHPLMRKRPARPYQRADIMMMAQANVINANQMGCMAWDTVVEINRGGRGTRTGKSYKLTIAQLHARFNGRDSKNYNFDRSQPTLIRARTSDGYVRLVELKAAYDSGVKQTYRVVTNTGRSVRATDEHPFLTPGGWKQLQELQPGDEVYVDAGRPVASGVKPKKVGDKMVTLPAHPNARSDGGRLKVPYHRLVVEADMNHMPTDTFITTVQRRAIGELIFLGSGVVVHHDDGDHNNNALDNLVVLNGQAEHGRLHGLWHNCTATTTTERVVSVIKDEVTHTYDLELAGAPHNFLANGFVVHNTGKTLEVIGAMVEAGLEDGPHLVCAPRRSLVNVWKDEVERCLPGHKFFTSEDARERYQQINLALDAIEAGEKNVWIGVIFDDLRVKTLVKHNDRDLKNSEKKEVSKKDPMYARADHQGSTYAYNGDLHKCIVDIQWAGFVVDEFHKSGLNNPMSLFTLGTDMLHHERTIKMSGTPMGGKPIKLFPVLRSIEPKMFSNKWRWIGNWLDVDEGFKGHKKVGGLKPGKEDEFYDYHARYMVRRLKREALPGLPPKVIEVVMTPMTPKQLKQYRQFADNAEVRIEGTKGSKLIVGNCILAEYSRLKQFANGFCILNDQDEVIPTEDSGKLPYLLEKLDELGVRKEDPEPAARAIIASQSKRMVYMVVEWLRKQGIEADSLTGDTKDSKPIIDRFRDTDNEDPYCIVMTTETGGVSLNLEEAGSVHILDESWTPDDDEQLEDRGDRGSRTTPLVCIYYRTKGSVQEYIAEVAEGKKVTNKNVLDVYREMRKMEEQQVAA